MNETNEKKLIKNAIKCAHCGDIIESKHTHDFKWCKCGTVYIDGGFSYTRIGFRNSPNDIIDLREWKDIKEECD